MGINKKGIATLIFVVTTCILTVLSVIICCVNEMIFGLLGGFTKDALFVLWIISYYLIMSFILKKKKKVATILLSLLFALMFTTQMLFIINAFNYIEIQHYFSWTYNIGYFEVILRDISYDFSNGDFRYLLFFMMLYTISMLVAIFEAPFIKRKVMKLYGKSYEDDLINSIEIDELGQNFRKNKTKAGRLNKNRSKGKINSQARSSRRKINNKKRRI